MRSRKDYKLRCSEVHQWTVSRLLEAQLAKDHGCLCTVVMVLNVVLRAAARSFSVEAASRVNCEDLKTLGQVQQGCIALESKEHHRARQYCFFSNGLWE